MSPFKLLSLSLSIAFVPVAALLSISPVAAQTSASPSSQYVSFNLAPNTSSDPITIPADVPVLVMGSTTTTGIRGVGQVVMERRSANFLQWVGLNSNASGTITQNFSGVAGTQIVQVDFSGNVHLVVNGTDSFVVTNSSSTETVTGWVSLTWVPTSPTFPSVFTDSNSAGINTGVGTSVFGAMQSCAGPTPPTPCAKLNTAMGAAALWSVVSGVQNTAVGAGSQYLSTGSSNTTVGDLAMAGPGVGSLVDLATPPALNATLAPGSYNTGVGDTALLTVTTGSGNTALGFDALSGVQIGKNNVAIGFEAMSGTENASANHGTGVTDSIAIGSNALYANTGGFDNIAIGVQSMVANTTGASNVALGDSSLLSNVDGSGNFALGTNSLLSNHHGCNNVSLGTNALYRLAGSGAGCTPGAETSPSDTGGNNIAIGTGAGYVLTSGSNNIEIGTVGKSTDNNVTRVANIYDTALPDSGLAVYVDSSGQLGTTNGSSERLKTDISTMPQMSTQLSQLRPVTFHYKQDPSQVLQYGLIAEEVSKVYPELVVHDRDGNIAGVHYEELAPILLSELQRQQRVALDLDQEVRRLEELNALQAAKVAELERRQQEQLASQAEELRQIRLLVDRRPAESGTSLLAER